MTLVDLVVLAVVALAAVRGWRRGGTGLVLRTVGAVVGVLAGGELGRWAADWSPVSATATALIGALVGAIVGWQLGRRLGETLTRRFDGAPGPRRPGVLDRLLGVGAHAALALVTLVVLAGVVGAVGPGSLATAAGDSTLLDRAADRLPNPVALLGDDGLRAVALPGDER